MPHATVRRVPEGAPHSAQAVPGAVAAAVLAALVTLYVVALWLQMAVYLPKEVVVVAFLLAAAGFRRLRPFLRAWGPFLLLLFLMDALREGAYHVTRALDRPVVVRGPIAADTWAFGAVPTVLLQRWLHPTPGTRWYDVVLAALHGSHFVSFLVVGLVVWVRRPAAFRGYARAVLLTGYAGIAGYYLFPTAPPWLAALQGALPPVPRLLFAVEWIQLPRFLLLGLDTNPVAAMPSLHAAFSLVVVRGIGLVSPRAAWIAAPYPVALALALVYGGEHYVTDLVAGYAVGALGWSLGVRPEVVPGAVAPPAPPGMAPAHADGA